MSLHPDRQPIWKHAIKKTSTDAINVTLHPHRQDIWGDIWKHRINKCNKCDFLIYPRGRKGETIWISQHAGDLLRICLKSHSQTNQFGFWFTDLSFENAQWRNVTIHPFRHLVWGHISKDKVEKWHTNATNVTMYPHRPAIWGNI